MTSPGLSAADTTPRRWGLPRGLIVLLGGAAMMVIVIIVYCAINFVVQSIIQPRFIG